MKKILVFLLLFIFLSSAIVRADIDIPVSAGGSSSSGGGGSRTPDLENFIRQVESWKAQQPYRFDYLRTLMWKEPITQGEYKWPTVLMYYEGKNTTVTRIQPIHISTVVRNDNPIEARRMLDLYLEVKNPGSDKYERVNTWPEKIQPNEYNKDNTTSREWDLLPSFSYLKKVGVVKILANWSDGVYRNISTADYKDVNPPFYAELVFNVTNSEPIMSNFNITPTGQVRYNDPVEYRANIVDPDNDLLNVTLHVLDQNHKEVNPPRNFTQNVKSGVVSFKANEYGIFDENDAGKNFTYYYSFDDGICTNRTEFQPGPSIRRGPKLFVDKLGFTSESNGYYWWQWYIFNVRVKNLNPETFDVALQLFTKTGNNEWAQVDNRTVKVGPDSQVVYFKKSTPFSVKDANENFSYMVKLSEYNQNGKDIIEANGPRINAKIVPYVIYDPIMIINLLLLFVCIVIGSMLIERILKRGIEAQESSSGKPGRTNKQGEARSGNSFAGKVRAMLRRKG